MKTLAKKLIHKLGLIFQNSSVADLPSHDWLRRDLGWPHDYPSQRPHEHWQHYHPLTRSNNKNN